ncbi:MAG TPA: peptidylprolyl isomerase [Verrucomicrobiales bacterium]|nr:peptidylprolyl isomerase [Verrucomicrobiales bacterium]
MKSRSILQLFAVLATTAGLTVQGVAQDKKPPAAPPKAAEPAKEATPAPAKEKAPAATGDFSDPAKLTEKAPEKFKAKFETTKGSFVITVQRSLSPNGADRFYNLVKSGYFKDVVFFRVISKFMAQFGINGDPKISAKWRNANIQDDPVKGSNIRGSVCFAKSGAPNSRSTQFFISFGNNSRLDGDGFSPFGLVTEGMDVVDKLNSEYGEGAPSGNGPDQQRVQMEGNAYLKKDFPKLDSIKSASIVE